MVVINKNSLIRLIIREYGKENQILINYLAKMSDEELARETNSIILRKGYFIR